jgi:hypothetical protein
MGFRFLGWISVGPINPSLTFPSKVDLAAPSIGYLLLRGHLELPITRMHKNDPLPH